jgi:transposase
MMHLVEHHQFDTGQHFRLRQLQIMKEARAASEPEALDAVLSNLPLERLGLEACALTAWLHGELKATGWPAICIKTRQAKAAAGSRNYY